MEIAIKRARISVKKLISLIIVFLCLAVLIEAILSFAVLLRGQKKSTDLFLAQIETILEKNEQEEKAQIEELKETYMIAAQAAAYIVSDKQELLNDTEELRNIALLLSVDELHIFNETGTIIGGTNPEYYGLDFSSGEQISFFAPMLSDKSRSMCQDITPNTAVGKSMMYAITWDENGQYMIQIGVEPTRLLTMLQNHNLENVIDAIPITEGYDIYVVDENNNQVIASSNANAAKKMATDHISEFISMQEKGSHISVFSRNGKLYYANYRDIGDYSIGVTYNLAYSNNTLLIPILIILVYLLMAASVLLLVVRRSRRREDQKNEAIMKQYRVLSSMADIYYSMHLIDLEHDSVEEFKSQGVVKEIVKRGTDATNTMRCVMENVITEEDLEKALEFTDLLTLARRLAREKMISKEFVGKHIGWFRAYFIVVEQNENGVPTKVIFATRNIDAEKKKEERLIVKSTTDELTGCYNRRAYEDMIHSLEEGEHNEDLICISVDVNELKIVNDTLGHNAGDELIIGVASCMRRAFSSYGNLYRTGGDEFVAFLWATKEKFAEIIEELNESVDNWNGNLVEQMTISYGWICKQDYPDASISEIAVLADKQMYHAKSHYYREKGVDRRGQQDAHKALCALYTKILKVNLLEDSYQIVSMDTKEQSSDKGFSNKISEWLTNYGMTGQVHPEDLNEYMKYTQLDYLKKYFEENKTSLQFFYRRKYEEGYKKALMEIIPANDYSTECQNVFLYVKNINQ